MMLMRQKILPEKITAQRVKILSNLLSHDDDHLDCQRRFSSTSSGLFENSEYE